MKLTFEQIKENVVEYYIKYADPENVGFLSEEDKKEIEAIKKADVMDELICVLCNAGFQGSGSNEAYRFIIDSLMEDYT